MPHQTTLRAVVFDLDGLLFNTEELYQHVGTELLARRGKEFTPELLDRIMGRPSNLGLAIMIEHHSLRDTVEGMANESEEIFADLLRDRLRPMPGAVDLLAALEAATIPKAIATGSRRRFVTNVLGRFEFEPRFQFILTSDEVSNGKPHPEIYQTAAQKLGLPPHDVMVLEDSHNGCRAAAAAGTFTVAVPGGHSKTHDFSMASLVVESLADPRIYAALGLNG